MLKLECSIGVKEPLSEETQANARIATADHDRQGQTGTVKPRTVVEFASKGHA